MRNLYWLFFVLFIISCSRGEQTRVRGTVANGDREKIYLDEQMIGEIRNVDSIRLKKNGSFVFKDRIGVPTFYNLHIGNQNIIPLLLHPGETAEIRTSLAEFSTDYKISGSEESLYLQQLNTRMARTNKSVDSLAVIVKENPDPGDERMEEIRMAYKKVINDQRRYSIKFVLEHMGSMAAIYALYQKDNDDVFVLNEDKDIQLLKITSTALDTLYPESEYVKSLKMDAANLEHDFNAQRLQKIVNVIPSSIPDIRLPDPDGDSISLSSLKGNVILVSFWASWNEPSVTLNKDFKRLYEKYHDRGFEIYQVSFYNDLNKWKAAIRYDELPWINVSELSYPQSNIIYLYNVTELPAYYLIDREGVITGRDYDLFALDRVIAELVY